MARTLSQLAANPVTVLKGVGPERAKALASLDITNVLDLLTCYPRRYLDRTREAKIADLRPQFLPGVAFPRRQLFDRHRVTNGRQVLVHEPVLHRQVNEGPVRDRTGPCVSVTNRLPRGASHLRLREPDRDFGSV